ncbi:MAG TPA: hypothetical protein VI934_00825 [Candidatus Nanoarchaeia archaeon]|nr:hypothetical protein [Candidatus Nanoarchaeia archaeon]
MKHILPVAVAALALELMVACGGSNPPFAIQSPTPIATPVPTPSPTATLVPTATPPGATLAPEEYRSLEGTIINYYTVGQGQCNYDNSVVGDLLMTRFYIHNAQTGKNGIIILFEGIINGITRMPDGKLYYHIRSIGHDEYQAYANLSNAVLPVPSINYRGAQQVWGFMVRTNPKNLVPIGIKGVIPKKPPAKVTDPFEHVLYIPPSYQTDNSIVTATDSVTGQERYFVKSLVFPSENGELTFSFVGFAIGGKPPEVVKLPAEGSAQLESIVLDTQHPANAASLAETTSLSPGSIPAAGSCPSA